MKKSTITTGVHWVDIPDADLRILCGTPADTVKHLMRRGYITEVERNGARFETGPNTILLSDVGIQNGEFANLAEFPVLQMFYRQGMIIPGHPNNTGVKPRIIGTQEQIDAQREYIFRGNYGLTSIEELRATGLDEQTATEYMRIKTAFAFGRIKPPEEMIDFFVVENQPVEIAPGVNVERVALNTYRFSHNGDYQEICLSLDRSEWYEPPYMLGQHKIKREYFSVVHTGEGDGWDINRPCMASILVFQGRIYLIDAGPSVMHTLNSLGMSVNEIDGIFHTHAHDDHFAGLTSLVRADHRLPYYAAPHVRASVMKKLSALMSFPEDEFDRFFIPQDLKMDSWNMIDGLEVKPVFSPHPVETTVMFFRALWHDGYRTYAHFADICSLDQLKQLTDKTNPFSVQLAETVRRNYSTAADVKKLDIGGGMIHGLAEDFRDDNSDRIVLSHTAKPLTVGQKEIGADTSFGMTDVLIHANDVDTEYHTPDLLRHNYPGVPEYDINMLSNCPATTYSVGTILVKRRTVPETVYLVMNGLVEALDAETRLQNVLTAGSMIGERNCLFNQASSRTYRAESFIRVLEIPGEMYRSFIRRNGLQEPIRAHLERKHFLEGTYLLGDRIAGVTLNAIAQEMAEHHAVKGDRIAPEHSLVLIAEGRIAMYCADKYMGAAGVSEAVGEPSILGETSFDLRYVAKTDLRYYTVPCDVLQKIPIVSWKLLEQLNRRIQSCKAIFQ
ncbi:MAG: cyclic nucleotide-binding domain-containing protein [Spirochaeta sp.]|nr:cyclic nucleotide-binding domain-containing protein [Spirochaeta sp.]